MIFLVVALPAEAKPIIEHFSLSLVVERPFRIYANEEIYLVISGIGKIFAAAATSYLYLFAQEQENCIWINLGIGGHVSFPLGKGVLAHKVFDKGSRNVWYPSLLTPLPFPTANVKTVEVPETQYTEDVLYEMEASGFMSIATRFSSSEVVHVIKVVSDNLDSSIHQINREKVYQYIADNIASLKKMIDLLLPLSQELRSCKESPREYQKFLETWHFSVAIQVRLRHLLRRWQTLEPELSAWEKVKETGKQKSKEILSFLQDYLDRLPVTFSEQKKHD